MNMKKLTLLTCIIFIAIQPSLLAQSLPANVTPQMIQQAKSMSPTQQQALASQLGVDIPTNQAADAPATSS